MDKKTLVMVVAGVTIVAVLVFRYFTNKEGSYYNYISWGSKRFTIHYHDFRTGEARTEDGTPFYSTTDSIINWLLIEGKITIIQKNLLKSSLSKLAQGSEINYCHWDAMKSNIYVNYFDQVQLVILDNPVSWVKAEVKQTLDGLLMNGNITNIQYWTLCASLSRV